ncbi:MAG: DUF4440 domain-containing protein [Acidobacteriota bacterium]|nr:DUF4440 domain-containing protein [Acidobacteriota bacterium]
MKRCPTCNKTFADRNLSFCIDDGTPLVTVDDPADEVTLVSPSSGERGDAKVSGLPAYQPPPAYTPPGTPPGRAKRKAWPWVVGILALLLLVFAGAAIAGILIYKMMRPSPERSTTNTNTRVYRTDNYNSNQNGSNSNSATVNDNLNENTDEEDSAEPPTDEGEVLSQLTDLEHEWTVANINADKKKLDRILADDYVGSSAEGKSQGKAEYLKTIEPDTTIQKWEFEDLKVSLNGDRASLTGVIRLQINDQQVAYRFTDKFVWRDRRWQATGSEVTPVK